MAIKLIYTDGDVKRAIQKAKELGKLNNSILNGKGNRAGILGEIAICRYLSISYVNQKYKYDLDYQGVKLEIKSKRRTVDPKSHYEVSVAKLSAHQSPDLFVFLSLTFANKVGKNNYSGLKSIWLCGCYPGDRYFVDAKLMTQGERDESNNFTTHVDMYNLPINKLYDFSSELERRRGGRLSS